MISFLCLIAVFAVFHFILDARALFERVISNFPPERARPLWERWARYEYQYGDLDAALKLEKRMAEVYVSGMAFSFFIRHAYEDLKSSFFHHQTHPSSVSRKGTCTSARMQLPTGIWASLSRGVDMVQVEG